jgi:hypothetical protein
MLTPPTLINLVIKFLDLTAQLQASEEQKLLLPKKRVFNPTHIGPCSLLPALVIALSFLKRNSLQPTHQVQFP